MSSSVACSLAKMLRIARIKRIMQQQEDTLLPLISSFKLVAILMGMLLVSHFFGCIWCASSCFSFSFAEGVFA